MRADRVDQAVADEMAANKTALNKKGPAYCRTFWRGSGSVGAVVLVPPTVVVTTATACVSVSVFHAYRYILFKDISRYVLKNISPAERSQSSHA
ncbi:hypothetical protein [Komagataeibacter sp. FXV3]|uniref:hypothetical protein n=1 Tax=Komagataeibacter sp. FXV3 TaxID=2608998 RepID=UPI00187B2919|nr:hypothetical protein [Komagataeibacter sp. FXV3]MBE7728377.1 hypothetical protein [Komagataeibacter sp. FXV3]